MGAGDERCARTGSFWGAQGVSGERYLRQTPVPGWDQDRLATSQLLIVGSGRLAAAVLAGAAALGIGRITVVDDAAAGPGESRGFLVAGGPAGTPRAHLLAEAAERINPQVAVRPVEASLAHTVQLRTLPVLDAIVLATGDPIAASVCLEFAREEEVPVIFARAGASEGLCATWLPWERGDTDPESAGLQPASVNAGPEDTTPGEDMPIACVIGGLALGELRSCLMPLNEGDRPSPGPLRYCPSDPRRCPVPGDRVPTPNTEHRTPNTDPGPIGLVGAGGLGTWFAIALAGGDSPLFPRLRAWDGDRVAEHNLNRQVLFGDEVGEPKAGALARALARMQPGLDAVAVDDWLDPCGLEREGGGLVALVSAVDRFATRLGLQQACGALRLPLANGGSGALQAEVAVWAPGRTACLECRMGLGRLAARESARPASCADAPEPSTVISQMIGGGLLAAEARTLLLRPGSVARGTLAYDALSPARLGVRGDLPACACWDNGNAT